MTKFGRYELLEELGRGGFGTVYKAEDQVLDRIVALKVLHPALVIDPTFLDRFKQEARTAARLDHPNLVQVFDFGEVEGNFFITMAYMSGGSLRDLLSREGKMTAERAIQIFKQTAAGLTYAHNKNVIHRDLKPGNILLDENGTARVSDLGFAKVLTNPSSMTMSVSGGLIGTPAYMAPELWLDQKATRQTDQYSLACILVEMLTGTPLFNGESTPGIMNKHFQPLVLPEQLPVSYRSGLEKALQQKPENRWNDVEEFVRSNSQHENDLISKMDKIVTKDQNGNQAIADYGDSTKENIYHEIVSTPENVTSSTSGNSLMSEFLSGLFPSGDFILNDNNEVSDYKILSITVIFIAIIIIMSILLK